MEEQAIITITIIKSTIIEPATTIKSTIIALVTKAIALDSLQIINFAIKYYQVVNSITLNVAAIKYLIKFITFTTIIIEVVVMVELSVIMEEVELTIEYIKAIIMIKQ